MSMLGFSFSPPSVMIHGATFCVTSLHDMFRLVDLIVKSKEV